MAINIYPESPIISLCSSPRISFSHDLDHNPPASQPDTLRSDHTLFPRQNPNFSFPDFDFCLTASGFDQETSSADELFSGGIIIPTQQQKPEKRKTTNPVPKSSIQSPQGEAKHKLNKVDEEAKRREMIVITTETKASLVREEKGGQSNNSKSFWGFKRSSSYNCDGGNYHKKSSIWSSLPLLARSNSTGFAAIPKHNNGKATSSGSSTPSNGKHLMKSQSLSSPYTILSGNQNAAFHHSKPPPRKSYGSGPGSMSMSATSSPVLNVPLPYITKGTSDLLGLGSLFRNGKDKKSKKR